MKQRKNTIAMVCTLACANTALYGLPYMKNQFYNILLEVLNLTHTQLSTLFSIYGSICMAAYLLGGLLTDMFSVKKIMISALVLSGALHLYVVSVPGYPGLCIVFGLLAVTSVLMFYPASMKTLTYLGGKSKKGEVFGTYIAIIDILGMVIVGAGLLILMLTKENGLVYKTILILYGLLHFIAAFMIYKLFHEPEKTKEEDQIKWSEVMKIFTNRKVWGVIIIIFCNYLMMAAMTYIIPYLSDVCKIGEQEILIISILRINILAIVASYFAGKLADKIGSAIKLMEITFLMSAVLIIGLLARPYMAVSNLLIVVLVLVITFVITSAKSVNLVTISEIGIPQKYMGTAIGVVSFVGYSPDAFFYSVAGISIDTYQINGYQIIFAIFLICAIAGLTASRILVKSKGNQE